jgi:hypothetical protein
MFHYSAASSYAYDGGLGYVFVIASWRPMRFDRFRTGNDWDSFDLADANYMRDPRPAIYELATLLAGDNREAYTVKFARFTDTQTIYGGYGTLASAYSAGYCAGYEPFGFASSPFGLFGSRMFDPYGYGSNFRYRGTNYYYDAGGDCYRSFGAFGNSYGYGYRIVQTPVVTTPTRRALAFDGNRPTPTPQALPGHMMPKTPVTAPSDEGAVSSPEYRHRGLITEEASSTGPVRRQPRVEGSTLGQDQERRRPSLQDMVNRRGENRNDGSLIERSRMGQDNNYDARRQGGSQPTPRERVQADNNGEPRTYSRPQQRDGGRSEPRSEPSTPRFQAPERTAPPARSEPSPRMQAPERTAPPPARAEPRSEPRAPERPANPPTSAASKPETPPVKPPTR